MLRGKGSVSTLSHSSKAPLPFGSSFALDPGQFGCLQVQTAHRGKASSQQLLSLHSIAGEAAQGPLPAEPARQPLLPGVSSVGTPLLFVSF